MPRIRSLVPAAIEALSKGGGSRKLVDPQTPVLSLERLNGGKCRWLFRRRVAGRSVTVTMRGGIFPAVRIADARARAAELNGKVDAGVDPRLEKRDPETYGPMTVRRAQELYMVAVREGRSSSAKRPDKPRAILDKENIHRADIAPALADRAVQEVTEGELVSIVQKKGKLAKVRADRLAAELMVFFGWAASLRGQELGLKEDPSRRLSDLRYVSGLGDVAF